MVGLLWSNSGHGIFEQVCDRFHLAHLCNRALSAFDRCDRLECGQIERASQGSSSGGDPLPCLAFARCQNILVQCRLLLRHRAGIP
jgi:hypothetical protein